MYGDFNANGWSINAMDRLYRNVGFDRIPFGIELDCRKPHYDIPDGCIDYVTLEKFFRTYSFGFSLSMPDLKNPTKDIGLYYIEPTIKILRRIVESALLDIGRNGLSGNQAALLVSRLSNATGWLECCKGAKKSAKIKKALLGDEPSYIPTDATGTYAYVMFHVVSNRGRPNSIQAVCSFQGIKDPCDVMEGEVASTRVFDISAEDSITDVELESCDDLMVKTIFGERKVLQTWKDDPLHTTWCKIFGSLSNACRNEIREISRDKRIMKELRPCFFGNELMWPIERFCFDNYRINMLCRWLYWPDERKHVLAAFYR